MTESIPLTLHEARTLQARNEKRALLRFFLFSAGVLIGDLALLFFSDLFREAPALKLLPLLLLFPVLKTSRILLFFQKKEFRGQIVKLDLRTELRKKYLSSQAGVSLTADRFQWMDLIVSDSEGRLRQIRFPYNKNWKDLRKGDEVILLRFVPTPVVCEKNG